MSQKGLLRSLIFVLNEPIWDLVSAFDLHILYALNNFIILSGLQRGIFDPSQECFSHESNDLFNDP